MEEVSKFDRDQKAILHSVKQLPYGTLFVAGVPGSGKTTMFILLLAAIFTLYTSQDSIRHATFDSDETVVEQDDPADVKQNDADTKQDITIRGNEGSKALFGVSHL